MSIVGIARFFFLSVPTMRLIRSTVLLAVIAALGCGGKGSERVVTGTVKYKGTPLITGYVLFQFEDGNSCNGNITVDGTYVMRCAFNGKAKVAVGSPKPPKPEVDKRGGPPVDLSKLPDPAKWVEIPAKYADPNSSGKEVTVDSGNSTINIDLD